MSNNNSNNNATTADTEKETGFPMKVFLNECLRYWKWFLLSIVLFTAAAAYYVYTMQPIYKRSMSVLIKDQDSGGGLPDIGGAFSALGFSMGNTNVYNELISLLSPDVMAQVVTDLDLQVDYTLKKFPHDVTLYGTTQPFVVKFPDMGSEETVNFRITLNPDNSMVFSKFRRYLPGGKVEKIEEEVPVPAGTEIVRTPLGRIQITPNQRYSAPPFTEPVDIVVSRMSFLEAVEYYSSMLTGELADHEAEVIDLSINDVSKQRADDVLNQVLEVYQENYVADKNKIAVATSKFIDERLVLLQHELGDVDTEIMDFKSSTLVPDLEEAAKLNMQTSSEIERDILNVSSQLSMAKYVSDYVNNPANANSVIPVNTGGMSPQLENQIATYNTLLLSRNNLAKDAAAGNPMLADYDTRLAGMRESIDRGVRNQVVNFESTLRQLEGAKGNLRSQLASGPAQAKHLLGAERQQKVKEALYIYLLQKREENELTQTFTADNTRVITSPQGTSKPVAPRKKITLILAFLFGVLLPAAVVYLRVSSDNSVRSRNDLSHMATPNVGEIPFVGHKHRFSFLKKLFSRGKQQELETVPVSVKSGSRDLINEAFRIVRGNLDIMMRSEYDNVIMFTSFNPGSGKSFICYNIAASFAIKGKKVLLIDCDLRHGSASQYVGMPSKGLTQYLNGKIKDWKSAVVSVPDQPDMSVLPIGRRPPNPAELLESDALRNLVNEARREYDIVLLDCPPVDVVVDTQLIADVADRTVFVVRAGLFKKQAIPEIDAIYRENRFHQMSVLLNATQNQFSRYGNDNRGYYGSSYQVDE